MDNTFIQQRWTARLNAFLEPWIQAQPALAPIVGDLEVALHGSTTHGIDDPWSDLDLWGFVSQESLARADAIVGTRFFEFKLDGKPGHLNLEDRDQALSRIKNCDMERIAELRRAVPLRDRGTIATMIGAAKQPMTEEVRRAWSCFHYVEMRGEHRACDTPIERCDAIALMLAATKVLDHAMRCAMVLDGEPYPYCKWLARAAAATPTGSLVNTKVRELLAIYAQDGLRQPGPESTHPVGLKIREIRAILIDAAKKSGMDEPWLNKWWLHMTQAKEGIRQVTWGAKA